MFMLFVTGYDQTSNGNTKYDDVRYDTAYGYGDDNIGKIHAATHHSNHLVASGGDILYSCSATF